MSGILKQLRGRVWPLTDQEGFVMNHLDEATVGKIQEEWYMLHQ